MIYKFPCGHKSYFFQTSIVPIKVLTVVEMDVRGNPRVRFVEEKPLISDREIFNNLFDLDLEANCPVCGEYFPIKRVAKVETCIWCGEETEELINCKTTLNGSKLFVCKKCSTICGNCTSSACTLKTKNKEVN